MNALFREIKPAAVLSAALCTLLCGVYPLAAVWAFAQVLFSHQANGSLIQDGHGIVVGSSLIGQPFTSDKYFHPRPSSAGAGYDGAASGEQFGAP